MFQQTTYAEYECDDFYYSHTVGTDFFVSFPMHAHSFCEILFVAKGDISYAVEGKNYLICKNSLIISRANDTHAIFPNAPTEYDRHVLQFDEGKLGCDLLSKIPAHIDVINLNGNEMLCGLFKKMEYYCNTAKGEMQKKLLTNLTEEALYNVLLLSQNENINDDYTTNAAIVHVTRFINEHITEKLLLESICKELFISKSYLHRLFVTYLNTTPQKYISTKKLRLAQAEIQMGSRPTEVATRYGFENYATFYRNYKRYFGVAPSECAEEENRRMYF